MIDFQSLLRKYLGGPINALATLIGKINWKARHPISQDDKKIIMSMLEKDYYIICTRHGNHLSTYAIALAGLLGTGTWGYYGHVCMNMENDVQTPDDFKIVEAIGTGSRFSSFDDIFGDASAVCLLRPKNMTIASWTAVLDKARTEVGKPYDTLFDLTDDKKVSCVELVRDALEGEGCYQKDFPNLEQMINKIKNLTPQMFRDCPDFEVAYEVRK